MKFKDLFKLKKSSRELANFLPSGFHGDSYLQNLVKYLAKDVSCFIETGTNVGSTLHYFANNNKEVTCFSCEPDQMSYYEALRNTKALLNVSINNTDSMTFLDAIIAQNPNLKNEKVLFWLDAHGYGFEWPLREEIKFITANFKSAYILIDDFKVPGIEEFTFDEYDGQVCSYEYIKSSFDHRNYKVFYPHYTEQTSKFHPLRGWGLFVVGENEFNIPIEFNKVIKEAKIEAC